MAHLPAAARRPALWKNGGGTTTEIAVFPPGAGMDDFMWRVSIADVESAGPFSLFPGIDRILSILQGKLLLAIGGAPAMQLTASEVPLFFAADVPTWGEPVEEGVRDLNVMVRRDACRATVERLPHDAANVIGGNETSLLIVVTAKAVVEHDDGIQALEPFDAILFDTPVPRSIAIKSAAASFAIRLKRRAGPAAA